MEVDMRGLLSTSALVAPFLVSAALAQDPPPATPETTDDQTETAPLDQDEPLEVESGGDDQDEPLEIEPDADDQDAPAEAEEDPLTDAPEDTEAEADPLAEPEDDATAPTEPAEAEPTEDALAPTDEAEEGPVSEAIVREQAQNELRVDWITGTNVYSMQEERIGPVRDLIFDQENYTISAAIVGVGGFLGIGEKQIAVRFDELQIDYDAREIRLDLTRDDADAAPEYVFRERAEVPAPAATDTMGEPAAPAPLD
jgi:sporulation protein YlmC with PRC-barrel domain